MGGCLTYSGPLNISSFRNPVDSPPVVNVARADKIVAFRFTVTDAYDFPVGTLTTGTPTSRLWMNPSNARRDPIEWYSQTSPRLTYLRDGYYRYGFQTKRAWVGTYRTLRIDLGDGVLHRARFQFVS